MFSNSKSCPLCRKILINLPDFFFTLINPQLRNGVLFQPRLGARDKCSGLVHWEDPEGWDGEGVGRGDQDGEHM